MSRQPLSIILSRVLGLLLVCTVLGAFGCSTPRERYQVLSFFFDGVPNPDAPKVVAHESSDLNSPQVTHLVVLSRHKPFVEQKCDTCHRSASGEIMEFEDAYKKCVQCHKTVTSDHVLMHGPVARGACEWCHTAHESPEVALLKDPPIKVCTQCHDQQLLGNTPPEHNDGKTSCISCHFGHGGNARYFIRPPAPATQAAGTQAAATQEAATQPAAAANAPTWPTVEPAARGSGAP